MVRRGLLALLAVAGPVALMVSTYAAWNPGDLRYAHLLATRYPLPAITLAAFSGAAFHWLRTGRPGVVIPWLPIVLTLAALTAGAVFGGYRTARTGPVVVSPDGRYELVEIQRKRLLPAAEYTTLRLRSREGVLSRDIEVFRDGPEIDEPDITTYGFVDVRTITLLVRADPETNPIRYLADIPAGARTIRWHSDMAD